MGFQGECGRRGCFEEETAWERMWGLFYGICCWGRLVVVGASFVNRGANERNERIDCVGE
jgi:hypothetical protein